MSSMPFLNQQDLQHLVAPPDEYILEHQEHQANFTIEEIVSAYAPPVTSNHDKPSTSSS